MTAQTIRIFASSPGDVSKERDALGGAVQELNTTLRALVPERGIQLELVRWETHTHPDMGEGPQAVVDEQLGHDFDLFVGMMWKRFGTPTREAGSGTEQEFRAAYAGWEERRRPAHILFYFSDAIDHRRSSATSCGATWSMCSAGCFTPASRPR
jgi:hypothetical protein